jgi:hypothetical protein
MAMTKEIGYTCIHCQLSLEKHAGNKCPYEPTNFSPYRCRQCHKPVIGIYDEGLGQYCYDHLRILKLFNPNCV